jgi:hypothetical protein
MAVAIAEHNPDLIKNIFHTPSYTHEGIFGLTVFVKGRPEDVTVDDLFPIYNNKPVKHNK